MRVGVGGAIYTVFLVVFATCWQSIKYPQASTSELAYLAWVAVQFGHGRGLSRERQADSATHASRTAIPACRFVFGWPFHLAPARVCVCVCVYERGGENACSVCIVYGGLSFLIFPRFSLGFFPGFHLIWLLSFLAIFLAFGGVWALLAFWLLALLFCGFGFPHPQHHQ